MRMPDFFVRHSRSGALVWVALAALAAPASAQPCPENTLWYGCHDLVSQVTNAVSFKYEGGTWLSGQPCPTGCYNLISGDFSASGYGDPYGPGCTSVMDVTDIYTLEGLPPGSPVSFNAELHVRGTLEGVARYYGELRDESGKFAEETSDAAGNTFVIKLPITYAPGTPFQLSVSFGATGAYPNGVAHGLAQLRFSGLPASAWITSCQSYDAPVPAHAASWGALKSIYRN